MTIIIATLMRFTNIHEHTQQPQETHYINNHKLK